MTNKKNLIIFGLIILFSTSLPLQLFADGEQPFYNLKITVIDVNSGDPLNPSFMLRTVDTDGEIREFGVWASGFLSWSDSYQNIGTSAKLKWLDLVMNVATTAYTLGDYVTIYARPAPSNGHEYAYYELLQIKMKINSK